MSEFPLSRRGKSRRKGSRRKKGLSEIFTQNTFKEGGKGMFSGAMGGGASYLIDLLVGKQNHGWRAAAQLTGAIVVGGGFGMPATGAGIAGAYAYNLIEELKGGMSDMEPNEYANQNAMDKYPDAMDEDGNAMFLADDGNFYYMEEFALHEDGQYYLREDMQANLYPGYVNPVV